jgi:hypothetical protein
MVPIPEVITKAWAENGTYVAPPDSPSTTVANQDTGYPLLQQTPYSLGGKPVRRNETNGAFNLYSSHIRYLQAGGTYTFEAAVSTAFTGYHQGAMLAYQRTDGSHGLLYSTINNNTNNFITTPSVIGTDWIDIGIGAFPDIVDTPSLGQVLIDGAAVKTGLKRISTENAPNTHVAQSQTRLDGSYVMSQLITLDQADNVNQARVDVFWNTDSAPSPTFHPSFQVTAQHHLGGSDIRSINFYALPYSEVGNYFESYIMSLDNNVDNNNAIVFQSFKDVAQGLIGSAYIKQSGVLDNGWQLTENKRMKMIGTIHPIIESSDFINAFDLRYVTFSNDPAYGNGTNEIRYTKLGGHENASNNYTAWQVSGWVIFNVTASTPITLQIPLETTNVGVTQWAESLGVSAILTDPQVGFTSAPVLSASTSHTTDTPSPYIDIIFSTQATSTGLIQLQFSFTLEAV